MVQPHSTFYRKPISSQTSLQTPASEGCLFSIQNQKACGNFHASFFSRMALYFCRRSADESRLYKDALKRWITENRRIFRSDFFLRWQIQVKTRGNDSPRNHWGVLSGWLLVTHITHSIKEAEGKKSHGMLGWKTRCESCGSSVEAEWRGGISTGADARETPWLSHLGLVTASFVAVGHDCSPDRFLVSITQLKQTANVLWMPVPKSLGE